MPNKEPEVQAIQRLFLAILRSVQAAGEAGFPGDILSSGLARKGLGEFHARCVIGSLVEKGMLLEVDDQYSVTSEGSKFLARLQFAQASGELPKAQPAVFH